MKDLDQVNIEREAIIKTLTTEKSLMEDSCDKKEENLEKELGAPVYSGIEIIYMIRNFLELNKSLRAIDQRVIIEMKEWVKEVKKVVVGLESQESKLKEMEQLNETLRTQVNSLRAQAEKQGNITPEFKEAIKVVDKEIEQVKENRLSDEELEKGKHLFKVEGQVELICWYLYNKSVTPMDIDKNFNFSPNTTNTRIREKPQYFKRVDKVGKKIVYTLNKEGKEYVEMIMKNKK